MANVQHIVTGHGAPVADPPSLGAHYIDQDYGEEYIAVGTPEAPYWYGPLAVGRLEPNSDAPTAPPEHIGQRKLTSSMLWLAARASDMQDWKPFPMVLEPLSLTASQVYANSDSPLLQLIYWSPSANNAPHVLEAPAGAAYQNMQFILVRPDATQPLRLVGMANLYCNVPSTPNGGAADITLTSPVNLVHVTHAPGGAWIVRIEPLQAPA